jgi:signal transduction histidine kinase
LSGEPVEHVPRRSARRRSHSGSVDEYPLAGRHFADDGGRCATAPDRVGDGLTCTTLDSYQKRPGAGPVVTTMSSPGLAPPGRTISSWSPTPSPVSAAALAVPERNVRRLISRLLHRVILMIWIGRNLPVNVSRLSGMDETAVIHYMDDPAIALDGAWRIRATNDVFDGVFGGEDLRDRPVDVVFSADPELAGAHATKLGHYPDVGGVVEGGRRHFDPGHRTVAALQDHRDPEEDDPDVGVFVDGDLQYYHLDTVHIEDAEVRLLFFRDITPVKDHEQDLNFLRQVMGRVLRHNLRNDLSVVRTHAEIIADRSDDERAEWAETILQKTDTLIDTTEKTRLIEKAVENNDPITQGLPSAVETAVEHAREDSPPVNTDLVVGSVPAVEVDALQQFPSAIADAIENAVVHGESGTVEVSATRTDEWATLTIADEGPGIPESELQAFEQRGETDLTHGSGAGLWLLYTVVHESGGDIAVDTEGGTTVRLRLPVASAA